MSMIIQVKLQFELRVHVANENTLLLWTS